MLPDRSAFEGVVDVVTTPDGGLRPLRLLAHERDRAPQPLAVVAAFTSGVRLHVRTAAPRLRMRVSAERLVMAHLDAPESHAEFLAEIDGRIVARSTLFVTSLIRERRDAPWSREPADAGVVTLDLGEATDERTVTIWFPADAGVTLHDLDADLPISAAAPAAGKHWVHHGSSISQGGNARDARLTWPAQAGRALGVRWTNLGFGGNAQLDPMTALSIRSTDADVITLELGINVVGADAMRQRAFSSAAHAFLDLIRDRVPEVPIVVMGAFSCPAAEDTPGPLRAGDDGRVAATGSLDGTSLTLSRSRELLHEVAEQRSDPNLAYVDGCTLLGPADAHLLADGLHPDQDGLDLIAANFTAAVRNPLSPLHSAFALVG